MMSLPDKIKKESLEKAVILAEKAVNDEIKDALELARTSNEIHHFLSQADLSRDELLNKYRIFLVVWDSLDDNGIPIDEEIRKNWNKEALQSLGSELNDIIEDHKKGILEGCRAIIKHYKSE